MQRVFRAACAAALMLSAFAAAAERHVSIAAESMHRGALVASDRAGMWLIGEYGELSRIEYKSVRASRDLTQAFRPASSSQVRRKLEQELGRGYEVVSTRHYVVAAPSGRARQYAETFESVYRSVRGWLSARGFQFPRREFSLVAVVYPSRKAFEERARLDSVETPRTLRGYYHRLNNRVSVYEDQPPGNRSASRYGSLSLTSTGSAFGGATGMLQQTIVHETVHQVAYNLDVHSRTAQTPTWVSEGLALVFESENVRARQHHGSPVGRINRDRYTRFRNYVKSRRRAESLRSFIAGDEDFKTAALDAYSQAWALSFYLFETRAADYTRYLQHIGRLKTFQDYPAKQRVADFEKFFGDVDRLEIYFLRFIERLP